MNDVPVDAPSALSILAAMRWWLYDSASNISLRKVRR